MNSPLRPPLLSLVTAIIVLCLSGASFSTATVDDDTLSVLKELYHSTGGSEWQFRANWLNESMSYCTWYGVCCSNSPLDAVEVNDLGVLYNRRPRQCLQTEPPEGWGPVRGLFMTNNNLNGSIPASLARLTSLNVIDFGNNPDMEGSLPSGLSPCSLPLQVLVLESVTVTPGSQFLSNCSSTISCDLLYYSVTGVAISLADILPSQFFDFCTAIAYLSITVQVREGSEGSLSALPPSIGSLDNLRVLDLYISSPSLTGSIPTEVGRMSLLRNLGFEYNGNMSGSIPSEVGLLTKVETFSIMYSSLSGPLPTEMGRMSSLSTLFMEGTDISGSLPTELGDLSTLVTFDASHTSLSGTLATELGRWRRISDFSIAHTEVNGTLPTEYGNWFPPGDFDNSYSFVVHDTQISGTIPSEYSNWGSLLSLSFDNTFISIPPLLPNDKPAYSFNIGQLLIRNASINADICGVLAQFSGSTISLIDFSRNELLGGDIQMPCGQLLLNKLYNTATLLLSETGVYGNLELNNVREQIPSLLFLDVSLCSNILPPFPATMSIDASVSDFPLFSLNVTGITAEAAFSPGALRFDPSHVLFGDRFECDSLNTAPVFYIGIAPGNWEYQHCSCLPGFVGTVPNCTAKPADVTVAVTVAIIATLLTAVAAVFGGRKLRAHMQKRRELAEAMRLLQRFRAHKKSSPSSLFTHSGDEALVEMDNLASDLFPELSTTLLGSETFDPSSNTHTMASSTPSSLGDWVIPYDEILIVDCIGQGACGTVSLGVWNHTCVAVKRFNDLAGSVDAGSFRVEALLHIRLRHPNIVQLLGVCLDPLCTISEFLSCGSLFDFLQLRTARSTRQQHPRGDGDSSGLQSRKDRSHGGLLDAAGAAGDGKNSLSQALLDDVSGSEEAMLQANVRIARDIAQGMAYLHSRGVIHRDLKSLNVLLADNGTAKVCDFGACKSVHSALDAQATAMTMNVGTAAWMAPETMGRNGAYTEKCDVYSFAVILWELASGLEPFSNLRFSGQICDAVENGERPPLSDVKGAPQWYIDLMCKCWSHDPDERPSFEDVLHVLESHGDSAL